MSLDPRDTPMGVADPELNPQLMAALALAESATVIVEAMSNIRDQFTARGWDSPMAQQATLLMWQSGMAMTQGGGTS